MKQFVEYDNREIADLIMADLREQGVPMMSIKGARFELHAREGDDKFNIRVTLIPNDAVDEEECSEFDCPFCKDEEEALAEEAIEKLVKGVGKKVEVKSAKMSPRQFKKFVDELFEKIGDGGKGN